MPFLRKTETDPMVDQKATRRWYGMPIAVLVLGILSITMVTLTDRLSRRQFHYFALYDALVTMQLKAANFHLWFEQAITGDEKVSIEGVWLDIDNAIQLSGTILNGGAYGGHEILEPLKDSRLRMQAEEIRSLLTRLKMLALRRQKDAKTAGIGSPLDRDFDALYTEIQDKARALGNVTDRNQSRNQERSKYLFWGILLGWICVLAVAIGALWNREKQRKTAENALRMTNEQLRAQGEELQRHREHLSELVEDRTTELKAANLQLQREITERIQAEEALRASESQLRHLSSKLLTAQEAERKRISRELHDELGGSLAALKMGLSYVERGLKEDQVKLRERCSRNSEVIDRIIDNVYRISRNLSPCLLEDLGLSAALRWLVSNFNDHFSHMSASVDIPDIDSLFPQDTQIIIYRILQESLSNAGKHSGAKNVSVAIERQNGAIALVVEDDGKGFDVGKVSAMDAPKRGLGLTTMDERVRMLGGTLHLRSQEGKGTRIMFTIPVNKAKIPE